MGVTSSDFDPRRRRTRAVLVSAFVSLARQRRYHEIRIGDILSASGVSRSTFYEHFPGKHALLAASMGEAMALLARVPFGQAGPQQLDALLGHFWEKRALFRSLLSGVALRAVRNELIGQIESGLDSEPWTALQLPRRLAAHALADGMLSPIIAWLSCEAACHARVLAVVLSRSSAATLAGLVEGGASIAPGGHLPA